ncbi:hypothetical protein BBJ28_00025007 [Nothophytophthora sp. Chile5]|nr:hypothetical protein BBJ28_00025007 [Nothophytophthora sp. Chile5]
MKTQAASSGSKLVVVALEGCHGCGKTALCEEFEAQGYNVLDEAFMDMPSYALHPQSLLMETSWVCSWFERVLRLAARVPRGRQQVFIADRSPFSAVLYSAHGQLLAPVIREQMREVERFAGVQFYTVHVQVERELLWRRILARLQVEPERLRLNEHKREWMEETLAFYENFNWDLTVANDERSVTTIADSISHLLVEQDAAFRSVYKRTKQRMAASFQTGAGHHSSSNSSTLSTDSECESVEDEHHMHVDDQHETTATPKQEDHTEMRSIISFNNSPAPDSF